jgi:hypothetical protein
MLKEVGLDESHSCKQGSGGGRFAWLGGLLSTRSNAVEQPRLFSSFRFADPEAAWGPANLLKGGVQGMLMWSYEGAAQVRRVATAKIKRESRFTNLYRKTRYSFI